MLNSVLIERNRIAAMQFAFGKTMLPPIDHLSEVSGLRGAHKQFIYARIFSGIEVKITRLNFLLLIHSPLLWWS